MSNDTGDPGRSHGKDPQTGGVKQLRRDMLRYVFGSDRCTCRWRWVNDADDEKFWQMAQRDPACPDHGDEAVAVIDEEHGGEVVARVRTPEAAATWIVHHGDPDQTARGGYGIDAPAWMSAAADLDSAASDDETWDDITARSRRSPADHREAALAYLMERWQADPADADSQAFATAYATHATTRSYPPSPAKFWTTWGL